MAFTLRIKAKGLFGKRQVDFHTLVKNCRLKYGNDNEFYILSEGKLNTTAAILYNAHRIGRGIFIDLGNIERGIVELSYNIPTTEAEITDFLNLVQEMERQLKKIDIYCIEEKKHYTICELLANKEKMVKFSLDSLHQFCRNKDYESYVFTLAMWPFTLTKKQVEFFSDCSSLDEFEQLLHEKQNMDVYYAKPSIMRNNRTGKIGAFYTLTEECESIFPTRADRFLNLEEIKIDEGFVSFYIYSENRMAEGMFDYDRFIQYISDRGAVEYDGGHIYIPALNLEQINEMMAAIS